MRKIRIDKDTVINESVVKWIIKKHKEGQLYVANNHPLHKIGVSFSSDSKYTIYTPNYASVSVKQF